MTVLRSQKINVKKQVRLVDYIEEKQKKPLLPPDQKLRQKKYFLTSLEPLSLRQNTVSCSRINHQ